MKKIIASSTIAVLLIGLASTATTVKAASQQQSKASVIFDERVIDVPPLDPQLPNLSNPVSPENPDGSNPNPGTGGMLSIDFVSSLGFGAQSITSSDITANAHPQILNGQAPSSNYVQVSDQRRTKAGWTLTLQTDGQFRKASIDPTIEGTSQEKLGDFLKGANLTFDKSMVQGFADAQSGSQPTVIQQGKFVVSTSKAIVMAAKVGQGENTWILRFGDKTDYDTNATTETSIAKQSPITLKIPGSTIKSSDSYSTNLIWTLSEVPGN
ncbi:MAG: WxL domain-containing protein [Streptococcaceae bacterium]|jgi:hypothetical protein|nr:WxL domain-containing protein [Streptococcaceae bacterium]